MSISISTGASWDWLGFAQDGLSTLIGAVLGFAFALLLAHFQQRSRDKVELKAQQRKQEAILGRAIQQCGINLETLINYKRQIVLDLQSDATKLSAQLAKGEFDQVLELVPTLEHLFHTAPKLLNAPLPSSTETSFLSDEVPMLSAYLARLEHSFTLVSDYIEQHNRFIYEHGRASGRGLTKEEHLYFWTMLNSGVNAISSCIEDCLFFADLTYDQLRYCTRKFYPDVTFRVFLRPEDIELLPPKDYVSGYRMHLRDFGLTQESYIKE